MNTTMTKKDPSKQPDGVAEPPEGVMDRLAGLLPAEALEDALRGLKPEELSGPGGLLQQLSSRVIQAALGAEMTAHLGHERGATPLGVNVRNGGTAKTIQTDIGPVGIETPRDRDGTFEPQLVPKRQRRLPGVNEQIIALYAGGMTVRDISAYLSDMYGTEISRDTISTVTDAVLEDVAAWQTRPLDRVYPIIYLDALVVKVREDRSVQNRCCYLALGGPGFDGDGVSRFREVISRGWLTRS